MGGRYVRCAILGARDGIYFLCIWNSIQIEQPHPYCLTRVHADIGRFIADARMHFACGRIYPTQILSALVNS